MTQQDLQRGNELAKEMKELYDNISLLASALGHNCGTTKKFFFSRRDKNKIHIDGDFTSFAGYLSVDRECMKLIKTYYENKLAKAQAEFESIGKVGSEPKKSEDTE